MFANLIESQSHGKEFKRRGRFVLATAAAYTVLFFVAGIVSIYAYDARVEAQTDQLEVLNWVPPVTATTPKPPHDVQPIRRQNQPNAPVDRNARIPERTEAFAPATDPTKVPDHAGTQAQPVPPVIGEFRLGTKNVNPPVVASGDQNTCVACNGPTRVVVDTTPPPTPQPVKTPVKLSTGVLIAKVISMPAPPYPPIARQIRAQGSVSVQILVDEQGKVVSAQAVSGNPTLLTAAKEAAMRARFTPTLLSGTPVKVQGTIIYNFVLQ
jgi:periplasmic protein TonB